MPLLEGISLPGLLLANLLPWYLGSLSARIILGPAPLSLLLGHGYLLGQLLLVATMLGWNAAGLELGFAPLASLLGGAAALATLPLLRDLCHMPPATLRLWRRPALPHWRHALWLLPLLLFLAVRGGTLAQELALRPLFAWDAWMNWVPRAVVWFHHGTLTPFESPDTWLAAPRGSAIYTLGNWRASDYPPAVPLLLLWQMLAAGSHDHTLLYLPWLLLPGACALALWGHLRALDLPAWAAALALYALLSQPLLATHSALAGYADLWMAAAFGLGAMALAHWQHTGAWRFGLLALFLAVLCALLKTPGLGFGGLLVGAAILLLWRPAPGWLLAAGAAAFTLLLAGLLLGLHPAAAELDALLVLDLPWTLPTLSLAPRPLLPYLWEALVVQANWHLLWLLLPTCLLAGLASRGPASLHSIALLVLAAGFGLLLFLFGFTDYFREAANFVTLNRTLLYLAPLAVYVAFAQIAPLLAPEPPR